MIEEITNLRKDVVNKQLKIHELERERYNQVLEMAAGKYFKYLETYNDDPSHWQYIRVTRKNGKIESLRFYISEGSVSFIKNCIGETHLKTEISNEEYNAELTKIKIVVDSLVSEFNAPQTSG